MVDKIITPQDLVIKVRGILSLPNLEEVLENAPLEVNYREQSGEKQHPMFDLAIDSSGFTLYNSAVRINYSKQGFAGAHTVDLWFMQTTPIVAVDGYLFRDLGTGQITARSLDLGGIIIQSGGLFQQRFQRGHTLPATPSGEGWWFEIADLLLNKAIEKYQVVEHLLKYCGVSDQRQLEFSSFHLH